MKGSTYRRCWCRNPETDKYYGKQCPKLRSTKHGSWYARYEEEGIEGKRRQPVLGPFKTKREAEDELDTAKVEVGTGSSVLGRGLKVDKYLANYMAGKRKLKASAWQSDEEALRLYWKPALGHLDMLDLRDHHVSDVVSAMELINQPVPDDVKPAVIEMVRRMVAVRADDVRRVLPEGEARHKKSTKPLSPARIERLYAPFRAAMNAAVKTGKIRRSPCLGVELPLKDKWLPLPWSPQFEARYWTSLAKRVNPAEAAARQQGRVLTTVERQELWASADLRPCPVMVWLPEHTGRFLDYLADTGERLEALFVLAAYCGQRRDELVGLKWTAVDLDQEVIYVLETGSGEGPKSEAGVRVIPLPPPVVDALKAWCKQQEAERLAADDDWADTGLVFTKPDGSAVRGPWASTRFEILAYRAGLLPIRFHDLRHGTASLLKAAKVDTKVISAILGHTRTDFTNRTYVLVFPEVAKDAARAAAAVVPRKAASPTPPREEAR